MAISSRLAVINVVGLTAGLLASGHMPRLAARARGALSSFRPVFPAVTCSAQSTYLTGTGAEGHGIVGNGWYHRELCEVQFWKQPDALVHGPKIWHRLRERRPEATTAKVFWWYNMYSEVEYALTPRPMYPADGRKVFDIYTEPPDLRFMLQNPACLGPFPFPSFWGPRAGLPSSEWIAASARWLEEKHSPTLNLVYLPHLDYPLQRLGPDDPAIAADLAAIDHVAADLADFLESRGVQVVVLSEYGISAVRRDIALNRVLRQAGWLRVKEELGRELLDAGASDAFAVADHQIAHIYAKNRALLPAVRERIAAQPGVQAVVTPDDLGWPPGSIAAGRAGDLIAISEPDAWFSYYYWEDDTRAPDFARTVDIHRKPGYDPAELFIDPAIRFPAAKVAAFLARKKLGFRALLEVVPTNGSLVRGSHGRDDLPSAEQPVYLGPNATDVSSSTRVHNALLALLEP